MGIRFADHVTPLYPQKLALTSPTGSGRSVSIVRSRTKATEFSLVLVRMDPFISRIWIILFPYVMYKLSIHLKRFKKNINKGNHVCRQRPLSPARSSSCIQHCMWSPKVHIDRSFSMLIGRHIFHTYVVRFSEKADYDLKGRACQ